MGYWGVKSYEFDEAADALDAGFDQVHGKLYEQLMDDRNSLTFEQVQQRLADARTLEAAIAALVRMLQLESEPETWHELARSGAGGNRGAARRAGRAHSRALARRAIDWLEGEAIDWEEATLRRLRRQQEIALLRRAAGPAGQ